MFEYARFRMDPRPPEYSQVLLPPEDDDSVPNEYNVEYVEGISWDHGLPGSPCTRPTSFFFVDGVQRLERWGTIEAREGVFEAAIASIAVGGVDCREGSAQFADHKVQRVCVHPSTAPEFSLRFEIGKANLNFSSLSASDADGGDRHAIASAIGQERQRLERAYAESQLRDDRLVVVDGRLSTPILAGPIIGLAKTIHERYLDPQHFRLVTELAAGERTPVFRIDYERTSRYSWFLRLPNTRPFDVSIAGIVRVETLDIRPEKAIELANLTASHLPRFASHPARDPRAPQNLKPIGALEGKLRHQLGDQELIVRHLVKELATQSRGRDERS